MAFIDQQLIAFKALIEDAIMKKGAKGKQSIIRSSALINLIHDAVKYELIECGVNPMNIFPHFEESKPEIKLAGFLKQKDQDICVVPSNIKKSPKMIDWGPMAFLNKLDLYGYNYSTNTLVINVRSQMSSIAKNADTIFERTFAEAQNLHMRYPKMVLGEVYLIPVYEYDDVAVSKCQVAFKEHQTDLERYISFFNSINKRSHEDDSYMYERCALLIVDFSKIKPKLYRNNTELQSAGLISNDFDIKYDLLSFDNFANDIIQIYANRYDIDNILR